MGQEDIFRLLLLVLLMSNESSCDGSVYGNLNEILIIGLLIGLNSDDSGCDEGAMTTFPQ